MSLPGSAPYTADCKHRQLGRCNEHEQACNRTGREGQQFDCCLRSCLSTGLTGQSLRQVIKLLMHKAIHLCRKSVFACVFVDSEFRGGHHCCIFSQPYLLHGLAAWRCSAFVYFVVTRIHSPCRYHPAVEGGKQSGSWEAAHINLGCSQCVEVQQSQRACDPCTQHNGPHAAQRVGDSLGQAYQVILQMDQTVSQCMPDERMIASCLSMSQQQHN